jgi:SNF2 family DNA or RNA helicase
LQELVSTPYHARYFAHELTRQAGSNGVDRLSSSLFDATVDLNPHQIDAALFALQSPLGKGVVLADEVGLGKTIEAGLILCQHWAERKRRLLVICPASLRKQWALELEEKFNLPTRVLDAATYQRAVREGIPAPFLADGVVIVSYNYASRMRAEVRAVPWDRVVLDEAHKLRNAYRPSHRTGQRLRWALEGRRKVLLTATPLQNSLLELYGLSTVIDEHLFGDTTTFRSRYMRQDSDLDELRHRLAPFCKRTLRKQVTEYVQYTERRAITRPFRPTDDEHRLYEAVSAFLQREHSYAIPHRQRALTTLVLRKLLASSPHAIAGTLQTMQERLEKLRDPEADDDAFMEQLVLSEEMDDEYLDEADGEDDTAEEGSNTIDPERLAVELSELDGYIAWARSIGVDTKARTLLSALDVGFGEMERMGANRKALIFTESRRTQEYVKTFLEANGYAGKVVLFNGSNTDPESREIYNRWIRANETSGRVTGSRPVDMRTALIEHFRDRAEVMIATEAAAEGVNLQFCSLVVNYDLPGNPQRVEQRIGRCHRYGQKHDVVVINYLIGLRVKHIDRIRGIRVVQGTSPEGERVLVIWRNTREVSNADLDTFFQKQGYNTRDAEFDLIYVNGDNNLENLRRPDETWKVRLIEEEFHRRMFDVQDV